MASQTSEAYQIWLNDKSRDHLSPTYLSNLVLVTVPKPVPGPGEVLVRIRAAALNYRDLLVLVNSPRYPAATKSGLVPVADGSGTIESVGSESTWASSIGEGVILVSNRDWIDGDDPTQYTVTGTLGAGDYDGTLRQYAVVKDELLIKKPKNLSFEEAAAIVAASGTAIHVLDAVDVIEGTTVLTQGTGGVSSFVIQLASALGARVIATSSSDEKLQTVKRIGASDLINYKSTPNWSDEVLRLTNGKGVDLVADVAGAGTIQESITCTKPGGTVALIGFLSDSKPTNDIIPSVIIGAKTLKGIRGMSKSHLRRAVEMMEKHDLHPLIGGLYGWKDASKAFQTMRDGNFVGKLVIKV